MRISLHFHDSEGQHAPLEDTYTILSDGLYTVYQRVSGFYRWDLILVYSKSTCGLAATVRKYPGFFWPMKSFLHFHDSEGQFAQQEDTYTTLSDGLLYIVPKSE